MKDSQLSLDKDEEKWDLGQMTTLIKESRLIEELFDKFNFKSIHLHLDLIRNYRKQIADNSSTKEVFSASKALELSESMLYVLKAS